MECYSVRDSSRLESCGEEVDTAPWSIEGLVEMLYRKRPDEQEDGGASPRSCRGGARIEI